MLGRSRRAHARMLKLITGFWGSQLIYTAVKLGIADALVDGGLTAAELGTRLGASAPNLYRMLRALASLGVFAMDAHGRFHLSPLAETLRSDRPESLRNFALMLIDDYNWEAWSALDHAIQTGGSPFEHVHRMSAFAYLREHPDKGNTFSAAMASISSWENSAIAAAYPFARVRTLVDVGGAHGHLLSSILRSHARLTGVLFDQQHVVAGAPDSGYLSAPEIAGRYEISAGDFFTAVPGGVDAYILKYILHDWDDAACRKILTNCRAAMTAKARILVVEHLIGRGKRGDWAKMLDINMLVVTGGRERSREEFKALFASAGLELRRAFATASSVSILEAVRSDSK